MKKNNNSIVKPKKHKLKSYKSQHKLNSSSIEFKNQINKFIGKKQRQEKPLFYQWFLIIYNNNKKISSIKCNSQFNKSLEIEYRKPDFDQSSVFTSSNGFLSQRIIAEYDIQQKKLSIQSESTEISYEYKLKRNLIISGKILKVPKNWTKIQTHTCQLFDVDKLSEEYTTITNSVHNTLPNVSIMSIKRVQNILIYRKYANEISKISFDGEISVNEKFLFHGTRNLQPGTIITSQEGFDTRLSGNQNLWGPGAYFAEDAKYADRFAYRGTNGSKQLIIASVVLGRCFEYGKLCNPALRQPPMDIETKRRFNSVSGITKNSTVYSVYNSAQSCPRYIIKYKVNNYF